MNKIEKNKFITDDAAELELHGDVAVYDGVELAGEDDAAEAGLLALDHHRLVGLHLDHAGDVGQALEGRLGKVGLQHVVVGQHVH